MSTSLESEVGGRGKIRPYAMYLAESGKSVDPSTLSLVVRMETRGLKYFIASCRVVRLLPLMLNRRLFSRK